jgi:hypothetical protein
MLTTLLGSQQNLNENSNIDLGLNLKGIQIELWNLIQFKNSDDD